MQVDSALLSLEPDRCVRIRVGYASEHQLLTEVVVRTLLATIVPDSTIVRVLPMVHLGYKEAIALLETPLLRQNVLGAIWLRDGSGYYGVHPVTADEVIVVMDPRAVSENTELHRRLGDHFAEACANAPHDGDVIQKEEFYYTVRGSWTESQITVTLLDFADALGLRFVQNKSILEKCFGFGTFHGYTGRVMRVASYTTKYGSIEFSIKKAEPAVKKRKIASV